jgi:hypothetical protein
MASVDLLTAGYAARRARVKVEKRGINGWFTSGEEISGLEYRFKGVIRAREVG